MRFGVNETVRDGAPRGAAGARRHLAQLQREASLVTQAIEDSRPHLKCTARFVTSAAVAT